MFEVDKLHGWLPKIIHQTYPDRKLPSFYQQNITRIKQLSPGWDYRFYDDRDIENYIARHFPEVLNYYNRIDARYGAARADLFRYLVIYNEGGIYLDIKSTVTRPLNEVLPAKETYLLSHWDNGPGNMYEDYGLWDCAVDKLESWPERGEFQQWYIVSPPRHPFLQKTIERVCHNIDRYCLLTGEVGRIGVLKLTGPIAYTQAVVPLMDRVDHSIVDAKVDLGFCYSCLQEPRLHKRSFRHKHYSRLKSPIIKPMGMAKIAYFFKALVRYLVTPFQRLKKSLLKRLKRWTVSGWRFGGGAR